MRYFRKPMQYRAISSLIFSICFNQAVGQQVICSDKLKCAKGMTEITDPYPVRYNLSGNFVIYINYCEREMDRNIEHPIINSPVIGFDAGCKKLFSGQYGTSGPSGLWRYFRSDGSVMNTTQFTNGVAANETVVTHSGTAVSFDLPIKSEGDWHRLSKVEAPADTKNSSHVRLPATTKNMTSYMVFTEPMVHICEETAHLGFDDNIIEELFYINKVEVLYRGATNRALIFISEPLYSNQNTSASLYTYHIEGSGCSKVEGMFYCDISVRAEKKIAPTSNGIILLSQATASDDEFTRALGKASKSAIRSATLLCDWVPKNRKFRRF